MNILKIVALVCAMLAISIVIADNIYHEIQFRRWQKQSHSPKKSKTEKPTKVNTSKVIQSKFHNA